MTAFNVSLGRGLAEPCSPYRVAQVFGAPLNTPDAAGWNCPPQITGAATSFDLSQLPEDHEVVVALLNASAVKAGTYRTRFRYYKLSPLTKIFEYTYQYIATEGQWFYAYAYIGYVPWEINVNGDYYVEVYVTGPDTLIRNISFTVTGIPAAPPTMPPPPVVLSSIVQGINQIGDQVYRVYVNVAGVPLLGEYLQSPFYWLSGLFYALAEGMDAFITFVYNIADQVAGALSWESIWSKLVSYVPNLVDIRNWFYDWTGNVRYVVNTWWMTTMGTVQGWIALARQQLQDQLEDLSDFVNSLEISWEELRSRIPDLSEIEAWWSNWTGNIRDEIDTWWTGALVDIRGLIDSSFIERQSWWSGWAEVKDQVIDFFADPIEYIWTRFTSWFLGPEG